MSCKLVSQLLNLLFVPGGVLSGHLATRELKLAQFSSFRGQAGLKLSFLLPDRGELCIMLLTELVQSLACLLLVSLHALLVLILPFFVQISKLVSILAQLLNGAIFGGDLCVELADCALLGLVGSCHVGELAPEFAVFVEGGLLRSLQ